MATHKGSEGTVKVGSNAVAEVTGFSFDETETKKIFNWEPISFKKTVIDCAKSIEKQI